MNERDPSVDLEGELDDDELRDGDPLADEEPEVTARPNEFDDEDVPPPDDLDEDFDADDLAEAPDDLEPGAYEDDPVAMAPATATTSATPAAGSHADDARLASIQDALRDLASNVADLGALQAGLAEIRDRLAAIELDVAYLRQAALPEKPSLGALLGDEPLITDSDDNDETLEELLGPMPPRQRAPEPIAEDPEPELELDEPEMDLDEPELEEDDFEEPEFEPAIDEAEDEAEEDLGVIPVPLYAAPPEASELDEEPLLHEPAAEEEPRDPVPLHPVAVSEPIPAPEPELAAAALAAEGDGEVVADGRFGLGSSVLLRVAPVSGFQELTRVQGALGRATMVRRATVEAYSRGEARLVAELAEATSASALAENLGANLNRVARVRDVSEEPPTMQITLA